MTVKELIEHLKAFDETAQVLVGVDRIQSNPKDININVVGVPDEIVFSVRDNTATIKGDVAR